jgi:hypothetical protein
MIRLAGAVGASAVLLASGSQAASAAPALTNGSGGVGWSQPISPLWGLSIAANVPGSGLATYGCMLGQSTNVIGGAYGNAGTPLQGFVDTFRFSFAGECRSPSGNARLVIQQIQRLNAEKNGSAFSLSSPTSWQLTLSTYGGAQITSTIGNPNVAWSVPWTNGNGTWSNPSRVTFSNTLVGRTGNLAAYEMRVTGTLYVTNVVLS